MLMIDFAVRVTRPTVESHSCLAKSRCYKARDESVNAWTHCSYSSFRARETPVIFTIFLIPSLRPDVAMLGFGKLIIGVS